jgi:hypothetical protein
LSYIRRENLIEASEVVRVELIDHYPDADFIRVVVVGGFDHPVDELGGTSPLGDLDVDPDSQRFRAVWLQVVFTRC